MEFHKAPVRGVAAAFDLEREDLARFVTEAAEDLNAIGDFWGGTTEGATFFKGQGGASGYEAVTGQIIAGIQVLLDAHHEIAERLRLMTNNVEVADWDSVAAILSKLPPADPDRPIWGVG
ncbi:hypothetical protein [Nonomuraea jiangxiensis]|uniref:WXG100 family type VII secretion target n=1 Tax=Nonomuraea jiangxiensis TaxID=633440 RepID=A0A1G9I7U4_9ACTN|nr:hypothetical protein [Nonomuraea jiangxiensis]SDL21337.1 hypothetical protein SAMN05421869_123108 [Nonomuraea jiangxiensis]